jgi:hypothetical protein
MALIISHQVPQLSTRPYCWLLLTIALSDDVEVQVGILGVAGVELLQHGPKFSPYGTLIGDVAKGIGDIGEPGTSRLINEKKVGKGVPT